MKLLLLISLVVAHSAIGKREFNTPQFPSLGVNTQEPIAQTVAQQNPEQLEVLEEEYLDQTDDSDDLSILNKSLAVETVPESKAAPEKADSILQTTREEGRVIIVILSFLALFGVFLLSLLAGCGIQAICQCPFAMRKSKLTRRVQDIESWVDGTLYQEALNPSHTLGKRRNSIKRRKRVESVSKATGTEVTAVTCESVGQLDKQTSLVNENTDPAVLELIKVVPEGKDAEK